MHYSSSLIYFLVFSLVTLPVFSQRPPSYEKNPELKTNIEELDNKYFFSFAFNDLNNKEVLWNWSAGKSQLIELSRLFGLYGKMSMNFEYRKEELPDGLFREHLTLGVIPDYSAIVSRYYYSVKELYKLWEQKSERENLSPRLSIELLLRFFQDFPYAQPPAIYDERLIAGLFVPPLIFKSGWADCDSKSLAMAAVLSHDKRFVGKLAMILVPGHALLGIEMLPGPYDETYSWEGRKYVLAEPTGLARTPLGQKNSPYSQVLAIIPLNLDFTPQPTKKATPSAGTALGTGILKSSDCPAGALLLDYKSPAIGSRVQSCRLRIDGKLIKHGPEIIFDSNGRPKEKSLYKMNQKLQ